MDFVFKHLTDNLHLFFDLLPSDWQNEIVPHWNQYKNSSSIYCIEEDNKIIGGGIVFSKCPPDIEYYKEEAKQWFDNGYLYLGFIWIAEDKRNKNLGSFWLDELKKRDPNQNYWLMTEEKHLHRFYQKNEFSLMKTIINDQSQEWLYAFNTLST